MTSFKGAFITELRKYFIHFYTLFEYKKALQISNDIHLDSVVPTWDKI